jgi:AhpD family alkylhydroperoxidase
MNDRMDVSALQPDAYRALVRFDGAVQNASRPGPLLDLVKLRASQLNSCAYCVDLHSTDAKAGGEPDERIHAVAAWRESPFFDDRERAALALTESMTRLTDDRDRVPDALWQDTQNHFDDKELAALVLAITLINAWNRLGVTLRMVPESYQARA